MKYLLDTHVLMWMIAGSDKVAKEAKDLIMDPDNDIFYSTVSPWEIEIKHLKYPDTFPLTGKQIVFLAEQAGFINVNITNRHINELKDVVPVSDEIKHNDPFDKMLLAQAITEGMTLITHDQKFNIYDNRHLLVI